MKADILCLWDDITSLWYVERSNIPGLAAEAPEIRTLVAKLEGLIPELRGFGGSPCGLCLLNWEVNDAVPEELRITEA